MNEMTALAASRTAARHRSSAALTEIVWSGAALALIGIVGALKLFTPFDGDQGLFLYMAQAIDAGAVLYVDVWDLKQPGIFWFYWLAGQLFGATMFGIRMFELAYMLALAAAMILCLRRYYAHAWLGAVAAMAAIVSYYTFAGSQELTQIEMLVAFPMFLSSWLLLRDAPSAGGRAMSRALAGALAGVCVVFKLPYAPIFVALVALAIVDTAPRRTPSALFRQALALLIPYGLGAAVVLAATALLLWRQGALDELLWISFVLPFETLDRAPLEAPVGRLVRSLKWYAVTLAPWLVFAVLPLARALRRDEPALTRQMIAWVVLAVLLIAVQWNAFWRYHFFLLFVPGAVLAARGIDLLLVRLTGPQTTRPLAPSVLSLFLVLPALGAAALALDRHAQDLYQAFYSSQRVGLEGYRRQAGRDYGWVAERFQALRNPAGESIYVLGNPLIYLVTQRRQALPVHGWSWEMLPPEFWQRLPEQLAEARPAYVFLGRFYRRIFPQIPPYGPQVMEFLDRNYDVVWDDDEPGRLYRRRSPPPDATPPVASSPGPPFTPGM